MIKHPSRARCKVTRPFRSLDGSTTAVGAEVILPAPFAGEMRSAHKVEVLEYLYDNEPEPAPKRTTRRQAAPRTTTD
jgi:hypothetical protein